MPLAPATTAASSTSRFQAIFQAAIKSYQKQTKQDLLAHPLASQLQDCDSTDAILVILQDQVGQFDKSHSGDERLTKWLGPTVNVLNAFSATISGGVSLVSRHSWLVYWPLIYILQVFSPANVIFTGVGVLLSARILSITFGRSYSHPGSYRQHKEVQRTRTFSRSCSIESDGFFHALKRIRTCRRLRR